MHFSLRSLIQNRCGTTLPELLIGAAIAVTIAGGLVGALQMATLVWRASSSHTLEDQNARVAFQQIIVFLQGASPGTLEPTGTTWAANGNTAVGDVTFSGTSPIDQTAVTGCRLYWSSGQKAVYIQYTTNSASPLYAYNRTLGLGTVTAFSVQRTRDDRTKSAYFERTVTISMEVQDAAGTIANRNKLSTEILLQTERYTVTY